MDLRFATFVLGLVVATSAFAAEASLKLTGVAKDKNGRNLYHFSLTAPTEQAVYILTDRDTRLVAHFTQRRKGSTWEDASQPWCANPSWPKIRAGRSYDFTAAQPDARGTLRIGVDLYAKPAPGEKPTRVWSDPLPQ